MKKKLKNSFFISLVLLGMFIVWTAAVCSVDLQPIGPQQSCVGFASLNSFVHSLTGVHMSLYTITDWLSIIPVAVIAGFALLGLCQWIKRKKLSEVDYSILVLGIFYIIVMAIYILFEIYIVNYRPVLINGHLEASYPSSTTVLVLCVMPTAVMQFNRRIKTEVLRVSIEIAVCVFTVFMVVCRLISGVHWFSDIIGGILLSSGLVLLYRYFTDTERK